MAIVEVVKYNGGPDVLAWKYPNEELGTWTQLIVNESQEAVLFKGGKVLDVFGSGRHTLDTSNIPFLNKIVNLPFGKRSPFTAEIWYVNKVFSLDVKWGTSSPIQIQDPKYGVFVPVRSNGMFGIKIEDSKKFLVKLVGTLAVFDRANLIKYFRGLYVTKVKDVISTYFIHKQISILEINAYIDEISSFMKERIEPALEDFGIKLAGFYVNDISVPEDDPAVGKLKEALAKRAEMNIIGYNYQQERSFDTLEGAAKNPGSVSAPIMGAGIGLGMGFGVGGAVGNAFGSAAGNINTGDHKTGAATQKECPKCRAMNDLKSRFCGSCGYDFEKSVRLDNDVNNSARIVCTSCGFEYSNTSKFCPECGNKYIPCPKCGADIPDDAVKCKVCGYEKEGNCPKCGAEINKKAKFCPECGESFVQKCPGCNSIIEGSPKFCPECGKNLNN